MKKLNICIILFYSLLVTISGNLSLIAEEDYSDVQIKTIKLTDSIYMLMGKGGNIGVCVGDDGVFLIDDQFAPLTDKIISSVKKISDKDIRFVINTHWHFDHVGGNENLGNNGAVIIAHENVRTRMSTDQFVKFFNKKVPASPKIALPVITFKEQIKFYLNGDEIETLHVSNAHTDGDAIIYFKNSNVIHTGDTYFSGMYPFIDVTSNGSINGVILAANKILSLADDKTKIIPGHGPLSNKAKFQKYTEMLTSIRDEVSKQVKDGKTLEQIQKSKPTKNFDADFGNGFINPDAFVQILYSDLSR